MQSTPQTTCWFFSLSGSRRNGSKPQLFLGCKFCLQIFCLCCRFFLWWNLLARIADGSELCHLFRQDPRPRTPHYLPICCLVRTLLSPRQKPWYIRAVPPLGTGWGARSVCLAESLTKLPNLFLRKLTVGFALGNCSLYWNVICLCKSSHWAIGQCPHCKSIFIWENGSIPLLILTLTTTMST